MATAGCARNDGAAAARPGTTLSIGYGENPESGIEQTVRNIALEGLVRIDRDGRPSPWLAERWSVSPDGLTWRLQLRPGVTFHNGQPATASIVREIVAKIKMVSHDPASLLDLDRELGTRQAAPAAE